MDSSIIKVDSFLNYQVDISFLSDIGREFKKRFSKEQITKILTIEALGIAVACLAAQPILSVGVWGKAPF